MMSHLLTLELVTFSGGRSILVDDRGDRDPEALQLSNSSIRENREPLDIEIYLTRLGENVEHSWRAGGYRYIFSPPA